MKGTAASFITAQDGKLFPNYRQMRSSRHPAEIFMQTMVTLAVLMVQFTVPRPSVLHRTGSLLGTALKLWTFTSYCTNHRRVRLFGPLSGNAKATYAPGMGDCRAGWPATSCVYVVACAAAQNTTYSRPSI